MHTGRIHIGEPRSGRLRQLQRTRQERRHLRPRHRLSGTEPQQLTRTTHRDARREQRIDTRRMHTGRIHILEPRTPNSLRRNSLRRFPAAPGRAATTATTAGTATSTATAAAADFLDLLGRGRLDLLGSVAVAVPGRLRVRHHQR